jgi:hypothetical protein
VIRFVTFGEEKSRRRPGLERNYYTSKKTDLLNVQTTGIVPLTGLERPGSVGVTLDILSYSVSLRAKDAID